MGTLPIHEFHLTREQRTISPFAEKEVHQLQKSQNDFSLSLPLREYIHLGHSDVLQVCHKSAHRTLLAQEMTEQQVVLQPTV